MKLYRLREEDRQFLYALLYATGLILFWRGIWEVSYEIPLLENVYFVLFVGLFILTLTGFIYREFDVFAQKRRRLARILQDVAHAAKKGQSHTVYYYDDIGGHDHTLQPKNIKRIETDFVVFSEKGHETFIPLQRVTKVYQGKNLIWRR